jgi:hypothetical protein
LGAEMGKTGEGSAFYVQIEPNHKKLIFNTLHKRRVFLRQNLCIALHFAKLFANLYMSDYLMV